MTYAEADEARRFVAEIPQPTFQQKYAPVVAGKNFSALIDKNSSKRRILAVASELHDAGVPGKMLNEDDKVIDIAGHLLQLYIYYANRASC